MQTCEYVCIMIACFRTWPNSVTFWGSRNWKLQIIYIRILYTIYNNNINGSLNGDFVPFSSPASFLTTDHQLVSYAWCLGLGMAVDHGGPKFERVDHEGAPQGVQGHGGPTLGT